MVRFVKRFFCLMAAVSMLAFMPFRSDAVVNIPEKIRVGLLFNDSAVGVNTAASLFTVSSQTGLQAGFYNGSNFTVLVEEAGILPITIRKDAYYINESGRLTECKAEDTPSGNAKKLGPYHVQVGGPHPDYASALQLSNMANSFGFNTFPVFDGEWYVWNGFYTDAESAQNDIFNYFDWEFGAGVCSVVQPNAHRVVVLDAAGNVKLLYGSEGGAKPLVIRPISASNDGIFKLNDKSAYRGELEIKRIQGSDMTVINLISMEHYLYGNVPPEIGAGSPEEALKAQAVVSRTYALNNLQKHGARGFDICYTVHCQVYKGVDAETAVSNKAVDDTKGQLVLTNGKPAYVYYFASSGGWTEDSTNVWSPTANYPYLKSVEDPYESGNSWNYNWTVTKTADSIKSSMQGKGISLGNLLGITVTKVSKVGRPTELVLSGTQKVHILYREGTRTAFGLPSQWFEVNSDADVFFKKADGSVQKSHLAGMTVMTADGVKQLSASIGNMSILGAENKIRSVPAIPTVYTFTGKGWGHAVGMSQEGAKGFAKNGYTYDQIIKHYFIGTTIG